MPRLRLFPKSQRYNVAKNSWLSRIMLLDNTAIEINLQPDVTGADCLERVAQCMDIVEIDYFGLQYTCKDGYERWVNREKSLRKQLDKHHSGGARNAELHFLVQFYVTNVSKLDFEITRYLYFLQLKHSVIKADLRCSNEMACKLASYALQAEFGDYDELKHTPDFLDDHILFPNSMEPDTIGTVLHQKVTRLHQRHRTMSAAAAELMYIKLAQQLPEYGHEPLQELEVNGTRIWIGACFIGIFIKHSNGQPTVYFKWPEILKMKVKDRCFAIETHQETVYFKMIDAQTAQYILEMMVQQHMFFQTEYQGVDVKWVAHKQGKKKSASLHDIRGHALKQSDPKRNEGGSLKKGENRRSNFSRPLGRPRESLLAEPLSPGHPAYVIKRESTPQLQDVEITMNPTEAVGDNSSQCLTPTGWQEDNKQQQPSEPPVKKKKEKGLGRTGILECVPVEDNSIDIGEPLDSPDQSMDIISTPGTTVTGLVHHQFSSSSYPETSGSQESFQLSHAKKEHNHTLTSSQQPSKDQSSSDELIRDQGKNHFVSRGQSSDHQLDSRTPPNTLRLTHNLLTDNNIPDTSSSGSESKVQVLERILQSGKVYSEFEEIPPVSLDYDKGCGSNPKNVRMNRYKDIIPYDYNRVKLDPSRNVSCNDYTNASYVSFNVGYQPERNYIMCQGPLESTCSDFWQMIWEQQIQIIIMLTNEVEENDKPKCHRYFPDDKHSSHVQFEQYRISSKFVESSQSTISRGLTVKYLPTQEEREVMHIQYIDWPDYGIPDDPQPFINFLKTMKSLRNKFDSSIPTVVHCSAGVGRSGVLVLADLLTEAHDSGEPINIPLSLSRLRSQRMHLVQTLGQYRFLYTLIIQYIKNERLI